MARILNAEYWGENPVTRKTTAKVGRGVIVVNHAPPRPAPPVFQPVGRPTPAPPAPVVQPPIPARQVSQDSGFAPFETLFHDFNLQVFPTYNFWEPDEATNDTTPLGDRDLEDVPRFNRLVWDPAPDIKDPHEAGKIAMGGTGSQTQNSIIVDGIPFNPTVLQDVNLNIVSNLLANGHMSPGVVETVVEVHTGTLVRPPAKTPVHLCSEDHYLSKPGLWGIPFSEFNNVLWNRRSSAYGAQVHIFGLTISPVKAVTRNHFFDGAYGYLRPAAPGGLVYLRSTDATSPIGFTARTCYSKRTTYGGRVYEYLDMIEPNSNVDQRRLGTDLWDYHRVKAKFIHTNFLGLVHPQRVGTINQVHHAETCTAIAQNLQNLVTYNEAGMQHKNRTINIPSFNAPKDVKPVEYVGYVIEKYAFEGSGFVLKETIYVPGHDTYDYIDTKIKYGVAYRYRIRSILRWTRPRNVGPMGKDPTVTDPTGSNINSLIPNLSSFWGSEWGKNWATGLVVDVELPDPPDELTVRPFSKDGYVLVTFKLPYNPQRDINKMTLWRKLQDQNGRDLTHWEQVQEYAGQTRQGTRDIYLTKYTHDPKDITGLKFNATQTEKLEQFVEYAPLNAQFIDRDVKPFQEGGYRYVYSALCHTSHGETSTLSDQLAVRINRDWARTGEFPVEFVSCAGVEKDMDTGLFATYPERRLRSELIVVPDTTGNLPARINVTGQQRNGTGLLNDNNYVLRIESLDNGQSIEAPVRIIYDNLPTQNTDEDSNVLVPDTDY